jgi:drug/metabolite transporter (DMT)-like permease
MDIRAIAMGLAFAFMWSSAFTSASIIVESAPPLGALSIRFLLSGLIAVVIAAALGQSMRLTNAQWRGTIVFGICQNALYLGLNFMAVQWIDASLAVIIASMMPLIVGILAWVLYGEKLRPLGLFGLMTGIFGVLVIMGARFQGGVDMLGVAFCVFGVVSLAVATMALKNAASGGNFVMVVGLQMLVGSAALAVPAIAFETYSVAWSLSLVVAFTYTTLVPGLAATLVWFFLVDRIGALKAATFHFLNPFFGVTIAALILGERLGLLDLVGVVVIMLGILAVQISRQPGR